MFLNYLQKEDQKTEKILFTGLDYAGKSSIILTLRRKFAQIGSISPTHGSQKRVFDFLGKSISEWDLGGQKTYRISYLKRPNDFFGNTSVAIYVIDIQDVDRFQESLDFLKEVAQKFEELELKPYIHIFFHKYDPIISHKEGNDYKILIDNLKEQINGILTKEKHDFHKTTIFEISSIIKAMSKIFLKIFPKRILIDNIVEEFVKKTNSNGVIIVDNNSLLIGSYFINDEFKDLVMESVPYFLTLNDSFEKTDAYYLKNNNNPHKTTIVQKSDNYFIFSKIELKEDLPPYYLLILKDTPNYDAENIKSISNLFGELLY